MVTEVDPDFWIRHPFMRGIASGSGHLLFTCSIFAPNSNVGLERLWSVRKMFSYMRASFALGGAMGFLSGTVNAVLHPVLLHQAKTQDLNGRLGLKFVGTTVPWFSSYLIMSQLKRSGFIPCLDRFDRRAGIGIALLGIWFDSTNSGLLFPKTCTNYSVRSGSWPYW